MKLFRWHSSDSVYESVGKAEPVLSLQDVKNRVVNRFGSGEVLVKPYVFDKRINWDTYIVTHNGCAVGYTNGPFTENPT